MASVGVRCTSLPVTEMYSTLLTLLSAPVLVLLPANTSTSPVPAPPSTVSALLRCEPKMTVSLLSPRSMLLTPLPDASTQSLPSPALSVSLAPPRVMKSLPEEAVINKLACVSEAKLPLMEAAPEASIVALVAVKMLSLPNVSSTWPVTMTFSMSRTLSSSSRPSSLSGSL